MERVLGGHPGQARAIAGHPVRRRAKLDSNQAEIVAALRKLGCSVQSLATIGDGCPDILVGFRGFNYLMEIKDGELAPSKKKLTLDELAWHLCWDGRVAVVENLSDALKVIGL